MKTVYLVRHGESELNVPTATTILNEDCPLTERGREQAHAIADRCIALPIETIVASRQKRAEETAHIIAEAVKLPVTLSELFIERQIPDEMVGMSRTQAEVRLREWTESFFTDNDRFEDLRDRAGNALAYLTEHPSSQILVVTHGFFMRMLLARLIFGTELRPDEFRKWIKATRTDNTGITVITYGPVPQHAIDPHEERWAIRVYNDHAHLG